MVHKCLQKLRVVRYADSPVSVSIATGDFHRPIRAAVVDNNVLPILICLADNTFDAFSEMLGLVVHRRDNAHERLPLGVHCAFFFMLSMSRRESEVCGGPYPMPKVLRVRLSSREWTSFLASPGAHRISADLRSEEHTSELQSLRH